MFLLNYQKLMLFTDTGDIHTHLYRDMLIKKHNEVKFEVQMIICCKTCMAMSLMHVGFIN